MSDQSFSTMASGGRKPPGSHPKSRAKIKLSKVPRASILFRVAIAALTLSTAPYCQIALADPSAPADPITSGRDALRSPDRFPWYDTDKDDIRAIPLPRIEPAEHKERSNSEPPKQPDDTSNRQDSGSGSDSGTDRSGSSPPSSSPSGAFPLFVWIVWGLIAAALCALAYMLIRAFLDREARDAKTTKFDSAAADEAEHTANPEDLPARVPMPKSGLLEEARRRYEAGDYNLAIIYLFSYELLKLDQNQYLRLAKGKTNREYLRELADRPELRDIVARCLSPFEDVFFGSHDLDRARFEACWNDVDRFNRLLGQPA
jgi:uncharacterized protein DUF4129